MRRGFSLAEVLIAVGLLAVSALALVGVLTAVLKLASQTDSSALAIQSAQELLEHMREGPAVFPTSALDFDGGAGDPSLDGFPPAPYPQKVVDGHSFNYRVHAEPVSGSPDLYLTNIVVEWGDQRRVQLDSYVFKP